MKRSSQSPAIPDERRDALSRDREPVKINEEAYKLFFFFLNLFIYFITSCDTRALHGSPVLSIPLEAHHKDQASEMFLSFLVKKLKRCNFLSFGQSC